MTSVHAHLLGCETSFVETSKYRTRVIEAGQGSPLILMHGGGGHAETYARNLARLGREFHAMSIDFIWHGFASAPEFAPGNWLKQFTDQVLDFMNARDIERASLEGESLGGWVCLDMALNHPDRVDKLILNTIWGATFDPTKVEIRQSDRDALRDTSINALKSPSHEAIRKRMEWLMPSGGVTDEIVDIRYHVWSRPETREALTKYYERLFTPETDQYLFSEDEIAKINSPTLVLWTDNNRTLGVDVAERLAGLISGADLHVIKNAAHWPQWEHPEEHDDAVIRFMKK